MRNFFTRNVLGFPIWGWFVLGAILAFYMHKFFLLFFGTVPAAVALHQAAKEAQDKADKLIYDSIQSEKDLDEKAEQTQIEGTNAAEDALAESKIQQDDTDDPFMD